MHAYIKTFFALLVTLLFLSLFFSPLSFAPTHIQRTEAQVRYKELLQKQDFVYHIDPQEPHREAYTDPWSEPASELAIPFPNLTSPARVVDWTEFSLDRAQCNAKYGRRTFVTDRARQRNPPPMLYTFPGSGNTWTRLLIEFATGYYTGSVYDDKTLLKALPGEWTCSSQVVMVKIHPHTHPIGAIEKGQPDRKCKSLKPFDRGVLLIRDPFDSIWSEYQRRKTQSHVGKIQRSKFSKEDWVKNAESLALQFKKMWFTSYRKFIEQHPNPNQNPNQNQNQNTNTDDEALAQMAYIVPRYEEMKDDRTKFDILRSVVAFLGFSPEDIPDERVYCAFLLSSHPNTDRTKKEEGQAIMSKQEAYTKDVVCKVWAVLGPAAAMYGYGTFDGISCD